MRRQPPRSERELAAAKRTRLPAHRRGEPFAFASAVGTDAAAADAYPIRQGVGLCGAMKQTTTHPTRRPEHSSTAQRVRLRRPGDSGLGLGASMLSMMVVVVVAAASRIEHRRDCTAYRRLVGLRSRPESPC